MSKKEINKESVDTSFSTELLNLLREEAREAFIAGLRDGASWSQLGQVRNTINKINELIEQSEQGKNERQSTILLEDILERQTQNRGLEWYLVNITEQIRLFGRPRCGYIENNSETPTESKIQNVQSFLYGPCIHHLSPHVKIDWIKHGIEKKALLDLKTLMALDYDTLGELLSITKRTIQNKSLTDRFDQSVSEKIVVLAEVYTYGLEVFENPEKFLSWFNRPNLALGEKAPLELANTVIGMQEIKNELGRIEHGIY